MTKSTRTITKKEKEAIAEAFGLTYEQYMRLIKSADSMLKKKMNMGGLMPTPQERKINPTTGLAMNRGGMTKAKHTDMRKTGMFYGGGMASKKNKMMYGGMPKKK